MIAAAPVDMTAHRGVPFTDVTDFVGQDYSAATFVVEIRRYRDAPGEPLVRLTNASPASQGVSVTTRAANGVPTSTVQIRVNETTIEALPFTSPRGGDVTFQYALDINGGGLGKHRRMQGAFIVEASANG